MLTVSQGILFTSPATATEAGFNAQLQGIFPATRAYPNVLDYITNTLYPPVFDGSYPYIENIGRAALISSEVIFVCNTFYLDKAFGNKTYSYLFGECGSNLPPPSLSLALSVLSESC